MSQAKQKKMREWQCNVFDTEARDETPLFQRKRRSDCGAISTDSIKNTFQLSARENKRESFIVKKNQGELFLNSRSVTPTLQRSKLKESFSMQKILQPFIELELKPLPPQYTTNNNRSNSRGNAKKEGKNDYVKTQYYSQMNAIQEEKEIRQDDDSKKSKTALQQLADKQRMKNYAPILKEKPKQLQNDKNQKQLQKDSNINQQQPSFSPYFVNFECDQFYLQMYMLNQQKKDVKKYDQNIEQQQIDQNYLSGIGENHKKEVERCQNRYQVDPNFQKSRFSITNECKTEQRSKSTFSEKLVNTKKIAQQQLKSNLESEDLIKAKEEFELKPLPPPQPYYFDPTYTSKLDESQINVLNLELHNLPPQANELEIKRRYFQNTHAFNIETEVDNMTGNCKGKGTVQIRVQDKFQSDQILKNLFTKGVKFTVKNQKQNKDQNLQQNQLNTRKADIDKQNQWIDDMKKIETKKKIQKELNGGIGDGQSIKNTTMRLNSTQNSNKVRADYHTSKSFVHQTTINSSAIPTNHTVSKTLYTDNSIDDIPPIAKNLFQTTFIYPNKQDELRQNSSKTQYVELDSFNKKHKQVEKKNKENDLKKNKSFIDLKENANYFAEHQEQQIHKQEKSPLVISHKTNIMQAKSKDVFQNKSFIFNQQQNTSSSIMKPTKSSLGKQTFI